jgi:alkanesulfonate monooxygenase SsuD/methylene tetrahydromethanopterin reductase-like flavin-dependent oxidoreductase (luciferase family)
MLARQAAALDDLSSGRMILGVGAGWQEREHAMFGYELGDVTTRMDRFEEGLEVVTRLLRSDEPASYDGRFFQLRDAVLLPRPQRPGGPPILVGGSGPKRTLPLVAHYAHIWNATRLTADTFRERSARLDTLLHEVGRQPGDVKRTFTVPVFCGRDANELERRVRGLRRWGAFASLPLDELFDALRGWPAIVGTPEEVVAQMQAYAAVGVEELMVQWVDMDDIEGLQLLAEQVLPRL